MLNTLEPITARFFFTLEDVQVSKKHLEQWLHGAPLKGNLLALGLIGLFTYIFWCLTSDRVPFFVIAIVYGVIIMAFPISMLVTRQMHNAAIRRYHAAVVGADLEITWTFSEQGIHGLTSDTESHCKWAAFPSVIVTADGFIFKSSSQLFYFIPNRAFATPAEIEDLKTLARQCAPHFEEKR